MVVQMQNLNLTDVVGPNTDDASADSQPLFRPPSTVRTPTGLPANMTSRLPKVVAFDIGCVNNATLRIERKSCGTHTRSAPETAYHPADTILPTVSLFLRIISCSMHSQNKRV